HAHVLGGGGEGHPEGRGELAEVALPYGELLDDRAAGGVGQGMEDEVKPGGSIYYHMVYYTNLFHDVKPPPPRRDGPPLGQSSGNSPCAGGCLRRRRGSRGGRGAGRAAALAYPPFGIVQTPAAQFPLWQSVLHLGRRRASVFRTTCEAKIRVS